MSSRVAVSQTSKGLKFIMNRAKPGNREALIEVVTDSFDKSFDSRAISGKLEKILESSQRQGGPTTIRGLYKELATGGFLPRVEGGLLTKKATRANMIPAQKEITQRNVDSIETVKDELDVVVKEREDLKIGAPAENKQDKTGSDKVKDQAAKFGLELEKPEKEKKKEDK